MLRAPTLDDLPALAVFFDALEDAGGAGASEAEIRDWLSSPVFDPAKDFRIALSKGRVVGWCDVWDQNKTHDRFFLDVRAHPRDPSTYARLLDWGLARAGALAGDDAVARVWGDSRDDVFAQEVKRRGFRLLRHFFRMEIDLGEEPPAPEWPEDISVRTFRPGEERAVYKVNSETFADHWDFVPLAFDEWEEMLVRSSEFDPTLWFIAEQGREMAGYSLCRSERRPGIGHVNILGVRAKWRRRGLGRALLLHSFRELRARGRAKADLGVDAENTTGAVRLYENAGMHVARRMDSYERALA
jgi:mycothiol synthase